MPLLDRQKNLVVPATEAWEAFPVALAWCDAEQEWETNSLGRELLARALGENPASWHRWIEAAVTRMQATGALAETLQARPPHDVGLEIRMFRPRDADQTILVMLEHTVQPGKEQDLSETVSMLSHELRTPLAAIKSSLGLVMGGDSGPLSADQEHFLNMTMRNIDRLERLVSDLLDVSRADAGQLAVRREECNLQELVAEVVSGAQPRARQAGIILDQVDDIQDPVGWLDGDKVVQILANLLSNALKFTPRGGQIQVRLERGDGAEACLLEVRDNGPGMDRETLERSLQPYRRSRQADLQGISGTGLGLHITRKLARILGGEMGLESSLGKGTRAWVRLPMTRAAARQPRTVAAEFDKQC